MKARDIMTPNPACCTADDVAQRAALLMKNLDVGAIPIVDGEQNRRPVGIVTDRDLCRGIVAGGADPKSTKLGDYMTADPACCKPEDDVKQVAELMQERQIRRVLVVDDSGACCGIVAMADIAVKAPREGKADQTIREVSKPAGPAQAA